jgi:hypothetical protein
LLEDYHASPARPSGKEYHEIKTNEAEDNKKIKKVLKF